MNSSRLPLSVSGSTSVPTVVMESGMRTLATAPLGLSGLARPIGLIYRRAKRPTPAVARFIETLRKADESPADYTDN